MQQEDGAAIRLALGRHIHIGHAQRLALMHDRQHVDRIRIGEAFERDAERLLGAVAGGAPSSARTAPAARRMTTTKIRQAPQRSAQCRSLAFSSRVQGPNSAANLNHRLAAQRWHPSRFAKGEEAAIPLSQAPGGGAIWPSPMARVRRIRPGTGAASNSNMIKRFLIAAIIVGLFLGGVGYFNLVFKPKMIADFMAKMVPPPATVTAETAKTRELDRPVARHRHAGRHRRRRRRAAARRHGHRLFLRQRQGRREGREAGQARHVGRGGRSRRQQGDAEPGQSRLRAPGEAGQDRRGVASGARSDHRQARFRRRGGAARSRRSSRRRPSSRRSPAGSACAMWRRDNMCRPGQALVWLQALDPIWVDFPVPEAAVGKFKIGSRSSSPPTPIPGSCSRARSRRSTRSSTKMRAC